MLDALIRISECAAGVHGTQLEVALYSLHAMAINAFARLTSWLKYQIHRS